MTINEFKSHLDNYQNLGNDYINEFLDDYIKNNEPNENLSDKSIEYYQKAVNIDYIHQVTDQEILKKYI